MKKGILVVFVALMAVAMLLTFAAPVLAISTNIVPFKFSTSNVKTDISDAKIIETPNAIHVWGAVRTANAKLVIETITYTGTVRVNLDYVNWTKGGTTQHYHKFVITFPVQSGLPNGGTFEGVNTWTAPPMETHYVLQGSGDFKGYTMYVDRNAEKGVVTWLLIH